MQIYYFTRTGRSKKIAEDLAERYATGARQIDDGKDWKGALSYMKAGFLSSKKVEFEITFEKPDEKDDIIVVFPVWAGTFPPAIRSFVNKVESERIIAIPTSYISTLKERDAFYKIIDLVGKDITAPPQLD